MIQNLCLILKANEMNFHDDHIAKIYKKCLPSFKGKPNVVNNFDSRLLILKIISRAELNSASSLIKFIYSVCVSLHYILLMFIVLI